MWKAGQLVTICGEVYRIRRAKHIVCGNICKLCSFYTRYECLLRTYEPKYRNCFNLLPEDCYFKRLNLSASR